MRRAVRCLASFAVVVFMVGNSSQVACAAPVLDQSSPNSNAGFNASPSNHWQEGVSAGMSGMLSRVEVYALGAGTADLYINLGDPWQTDANEFSTSLVAASEGWVTIDTSAAGIHVDAGDAFVIGIDGADGGVWLGGSYWLPNGGYDAGGAWLNGGSYADGGWDLAFRTYVDSDSTGPAVPVPGALVLASLGTGLIGWLRSRRSR